MSALALAPLISVVAGALAALTAEAFLKRGRRELPAALAVLSLAAAAVFVVLSWARRPACFGGRLSLDSLALLLTGLFIVVAALVLLMSLAYAERRRIELGELSGLLLLAVAGLMIMVSTKDWLIVFLGLEVLSVASYALTGLWRKEARSREAAAKYFLMGSFAGAFFVFGLALVFGAGGGLSFSSGIVLGHGAAAVAGLAGLGMILAALFFKIAVVPFHMWAPDVYEGAPTPVAAFLTIAPKAAGLAVLFRLLWPLPAPGAVASVYLPVLGAMAVLTMFVGNLAALRQSNVKRLLAYSAIAHSGYLLVGVVAGDGPGLVFYLIVYGFMNGGAFAVLAALSGKGEEHTGLSELAGLGRRHPWLAGSFAVFLLSLAGVPPTAGFLAKFNLFSAAVARGHIVLAVAAVLASLVSVAYYFKVIAAMYMRGPEAEPVLEPDAPALLLAIFVCLLGVVELGLWPGNLLVLIRQALGGPL